MLYSFICLFNILSWSFLCFCFSRSSASDRCRSSGFMSDLAIRSAASCCSRFLFISAKNAELRSAMSPDCLRLSNCCPEQIRNEMGRGREEKRANEKDTPQTGGQPTSSA